MMSYHIFPSVPGDIRGVFRKAPFLLVQTEGEYIDSDGNITKSTDQVLNDLGDGHCWYSPNKEGSTITLWFPRYSLYVTNYSIQTPYEKCTDEYFPKEWKFYGYNGKVWVLLSSIDEERHAFGEIRTYNVTLDHFETFNKFQFVGGKNSHETKQGHFVIQALDLFGVLFNPFFSLKDNYSFRLFEILFCILFLGAE